MKVYIKNYFAKTENTMVANKKGLYLGLLLSLLGIGNVMQAKRATVVNRTKYKATIQLSYRVKVKNIDLNPSEKITIRSGINKTLQATVHDPKESMDTNKIEGILPRRVYTIRKMLNKYILLEQKER